MAPEHLDKPAEMVFTQLNSKTVGPPDSDTGLSTDLAPDTIITVGDFDRVRNQINIQKNNKNALEVLNEIGRITGMQSQSGPIPNTQFVSTVTDSAGTGNPTGTVYQPENGTCWQLCAAELSLKNATNARLRIGTLLNSSRVQISLISSAGIFELNEPIFISYPCFLEYQIIGSSGSNTIAFSLVRVR